MCLSLARGPAMRRAGDAGGGLSLGSYGYPPVYLIPKALHTFHIAATASMRPKNAPSP